MNSFSASSPTPTEACDFCRAPLAEIHQHVMECATRTLECACDACAILFGGQDQKYRRVPRRTRYLPQFRMTDAQWSALMIPIGIAFLFRHDASGKIAALYPEVRSMETDVEGLLIYRVGSASEHYIIPIDECFKLVGIIRMNWKGFSGGMLVWQEIGKFLERLKQRSTTRAAA
jgi:hypothetical protein